MNDDRYWNLMSRYASRDLSIEETEELLEWLGDDPARANLLKEFTDTWDTTKNYPENFEVDTNAGWKKLKSAIDVSRKNKVKPIFNYAFIGIAASLLLVAFTVFWSYNNFSGSKIIEVSTLNGQNKELVLPDGSKVWLNANSSISYPDKLNEDAIREVNLKGEAFFDVAKNPGKRFVIKTVGTITQVLGTSFNVREDNEGSINVSVVSGKVSFKSRENPEQELVLMPGDAGIISREGYAAKAKFPDQNFLYWKNKQLIFNNATLSEVLKTIENSYQVNFQLNNEELQKHRITTSFERATFPEVVEVLEALLDLKIEKTDSIYVVRKKQ